MGDSCHEIVSRRSTYYSKVGTSSSTVDTRLKRVYKTATEVLQQIRRIQFWNHLSAKEVLQSRGQNLKAAPEVLKEEKENFNVNENIQWYYIVR